MEVRRALGLAGAALLGACGHHAAPRAVVPQPTSITLQDALVQVVDALNAARKTSDGYPQRIGIDPCSVQVTFDITASGTGDNKLVLDASVKPPAPVPISIGVNASSQDTLKAERGNHITVTMNTPACNPANTLGTLRPEKVHELSEQNARVRRSGTTYYTR